MQRKRPTPAPAMLRLAIYLAVAVALAGAAQAQRVRSDEATAYQDAQTTKPEKVHGTFYNVCSAICWYLPNRVLDFIDIPKLYLTAGDGNGVQVRMTGLLDATWINDDCSAIGLADRESFGFFGEARDDRHFGFLAAQQGDLTGDPTEIGLAGHIIVLGGHIGLSLKEAADFLTGIVGIDLCGDDHGPTFADYTPEPVMEAGHHPVPDSPLPPASSIPDPTPAQALSDDTSTTGSAATATEPSSAAPAPGAMGTESNTAKSTSTSQIYEIEPGDKTLPVPPKAE